MIQRFKGKAAKALWHGRASKLPADILQRAGDKLNSIDAAPSLDSLRIPPSNHLEALTGDRKGQYSIRINNQQRICFHWKDGNAYDVEIIDYHQNPTSNFYPMTPEAKAMLAATPGGILLREFLEPMGISQAEFARRTGIPASRITEIIKGRRAISAETAIALGIFFNMEAQFWMNLQSHYDLRRAQLEKEAELRKRIDPLPVAAVAEDQSSYNSGKRKGSTQRQTEDD